MTSPLSADLPGSGVSVLVVSPHRLVRAGIRAVLREEDGVTVVAETATPAGMVALCRRLRPDTVVLDVDLPGLDDGPLAERVGAPVLLLGDEPASEPVVTLLRSGVRGFASKDSPPGALVNAIVEVAAGNGSLPPPLIGALLEWFAGQADGAVESGVVDRLTPRQREVLRLIAEGKSNADIAGALVVSTSTVKSHIYHLLKRLEVGDRASAVALAYRSGLVPVTRGLSPRAERAGD
jgi:DNA-binding NarL/FixJ family response regulator